MPPADRYHHSSGRALRMRRTVLEPAAVEGTSLALWYPPDTNEAAAAARIERGWRRRQSPFFDCLLCVLAARRSHARAHHSTSPPPTCGAHTRTTHLLPPRASMRPARPPWRASPAPARRPQGPRRASRPPRRAPPRPAPASSRAWQSVRRLDPATPPRGRAARRAPVASRPSRPAQKRRAKGKQVYLIVDVSCQLSACLHEQLISLRRVHVIGTPRASRALGGARPARGGGCQVGQHLRLPRPVQRAPCDLRESALRGAVGGARAHASKTPCAGRACAPPGPRAPTRTFHTSESKVSEPMRRLARTTRKLTGPRSVPLASA